uniref:MobC family plasmid mobilization relaxosome protein n=1 Tax=Actinomadura sp. CA-154981 TaxID=3240037 RepID=UPI003F490983
MTASERRALVVEFLAARRQVAGIAGNVNQLAKAANAGHPPEELAPALRAVQQAMERLRPPWTRWAERPGGDWSRTCADRSRDGYGPRCIPGTGTGRRRGPCLGSQQDVEVVTRSAPVLAQLDRPVLWGAASQVVEPNQRSKTRAKPPPTSTVPTNDPQALSPGTPLHRFAA